MLRRWEELPDFMRVEEVRPYYDSLCKKTLQLALKRVFDFIMALVLIVILSIPMVVIAVWIKMDSKGPVFYRQVRVTSYGKRFRIHKFRTMTENADKIGSAVTVSGDNRITKVGKRIRSMRLDEIPQLFDVLIGDMSFVGTRPEAVKYVELYKREYYATLLLPAGITSKASINYKDEDKLLKDVSNVDQIYLEEILPEKMKWNLQGINEYSFLSDIKLMFLTVYAVVKR